MARILIIEDNADNLALMRYLLNAFGHVVTSAGDGEQGLAQALRDEADLIVCDVHLPRKDGYEVARSLMAHPGFATPLVAVTALAMVGDRDKVLAAGFNGYIAKPIEPTEFVSQIEAYLREPPSPASTPKAAASAASAHATAVPETTQDRVLVVDDSPVNHALTRALLEPFGYRLRFALSAETALAQLAAHEFELLISDLHMPEDDGLALLARVKAEPRWARLPFMLLSSSAHGEADARRARALGVSRFLRRPLEPERVLAAVRECVALGRREGQA